MADLQKIADDLSGLTVLEASELSKILEIRQVVQQGQVQSVLVLQIMDMI